MTAFPARMTRVMQGAGAFMCQTIRCVMTEFHAPWAHVLPTAGVRRTLPHAFHVHFSGFLGAQAASKMVTLWQ